jgi:hypothetical protein
MAANEGQINELVRVGAEPLNSAPGAEEGSLQNLKGRLDSRPDLPAPPETL